MCGIFGVVEKEGIDKNELLKGIRVKCQHRGPDNTSDLFLHLIMIINYIVFHRLSINGIDEKSNQPIEVNNVTVICNGEIIIIKN